jgi:hypothetical protein
MKRLIFALIMALCIATQAWSGTGIGTNVLGENSADNAYVSDSVVGNADGSVLERLEYVQTQETSILADTAAIDALRAHAVSKTISTIANGNNNLFVVAGGPIKIIEIVGYVATEIGAESCLINYNIDPTAPATDTVFGTDGTALEINADAVGTLYTWTGVVAADLVATTNGVALGLPTYSGIIVPAGSIELAAVHDGTCAGAITVYMRYVPLASGATVTAAP